MKEFLPPPEHTEGRTAPEERPLLLMTIEAMRAFINLPLEDIPDIEAEFRVRAI